MMLLDFIAYLVMLALSLAVLGIILGCVFGVTCIGGFIFELFNELKNTALKAKLKSY